MTRNLRKDPAELGWLIPALIALAVYLLTMCRTVYVGDSGEFSLGLKTLGILHPPGYPLFSIVGHVFVTLLSFLKPALAANLFGVFLAAIAIPALFFLLDGRKNPLQVAALTLLWAFSPAYWEETNGIEVYALALALVAALSALALSQYRRKWYLLVYLLGLTLAHHFSALAVVPALAYLFFTDDKRHRNALAIYALLFALGLSIYFYLPVRAGVSPLADWGHVTTLSAFWDHITAKSYHGAVDFSLSGLPESISLFSATVLGNWWWLGIAVAAWGAVYGFRHYRQRTIFALILLGCNLLLSAFYQIADIDSYYLPGLLAFWLLMSQGILGLGEKLPKARLASLAGTMLAALLLLTIQYHRQDQSGNRLAENFGKLIIDTAGKGTVFTNDDNSTFCSLYMRYGEDYRPQVEVFDGALRAPALLAEASWLSKQTVHDFNNALGIYLHSAPGDKYIEDLKLAPQGSHVESYGILYALQPPPRPAPPIPDLWQGDPPRDFKARGILVNLEASRAEMLLKQTPPDSSGAKKCLNRALALYEHEPRGALHNQLGLGFRQYGAEDEALICYRRALEAPRLSAGERKEVIFNISNVYKDRGERLAQAGDYNGSVEAFKAALAYDPGNDEVTYNIGLIYVKYLKQFDLGLLYLENYLQNHPADKDVANLVGMLKNAKR